jgi:hypothetical protein
MHGDGIIRALVRAPPFVRLHYIGTIVIPTEYKRTVGPRRAPALACFITPLLWNQLFVERTVKIFPEANWKIF